ncbi:MAG: MFS transporter, partial [Gemmatimonadota bacterium]
MSDSHEIRLGLRENWRQFLLLVLINAFVGGMVGLERAVLPLVAEEEFGMASRTAILSFIVSFGIVKALANSAAGHLGDRWGRRRTLLAGWVVGLPVPFLVMWAPSWSWIVFANVLLGVNQGLAWSSTVIMKIDLVGPRQRGLAMGLNEAAGYLAVSLAALASGYIAAAHALRPHPFYLGVAFAVLGLLLTLLFVRETREHARKEASLHENSTRSGGTAGGGDGGDDTHPRQVGQGRTFRQVLLDTSWRNRTLFSASQAGMVNNLNDGLAWGLFPIYFATAGLDVERIGWLAALYPAVWGLGQLVTGWLSDRTGRKPLIVSGMVVQA